MRVVSLVPSITETLLGWGLVPVGVTRFCEQPDLVAVGGTKDPDIDAIVALDPDLVVVNDEENRRQDAEAIEARGLALHVTHVESLAEVAPALTQLAAAVGVEARPQALPPARPIGLRAFVPIWRRPWMSMSARCYGSSLLAHLGVANVFGDADQRYPEVDLDDARSCRPDVVLAPSEPYPFGERHRAELETVAPVVPVDGQDLFWWGVRTPAAVERLGLVIDRLS